MKVRPDFLEEAALRGQGFRWIAGVDEAGRGPLAGPVVGGAVILPEEIDASWAAEIQDSKQLSPSQREWLFGEIQRHAVAVAVGIASSQEIDARGIGPASRLAMIRAIEQLAVAPDFILIDGFALPSLLRPQKWIIKGDRRCLSIAAASIVAKVHRDGIMKEMDRAYPGYAFAQHKGYGTAQHLGCLQRLGACPIHRRSFDPVRRLVEAT